MVVEEEKRLAAVILVLGCDRRRVIKQVSSGVSLDRFRLFLQLQPDTLSCQQSLSNSQPEEERRRQ